VAPVRPESSRSTAVVEPALANKEAEVHELSPIVIPLGFFAMVVLIVAIAVMKKMRDRELQAHQELRLREMDHERRLKELEIEKAKVEMEKVKSAPSV
jgi:hypothetical protein